MSGSAPLSIVELLALPKRLGEARRAASDPADADVRLDYDVEAQVPGQLRVFVRVLRALVENFSIGLWYAEPGNAPTVLLRINGDHGGHRNPDGSYFDQGPHLHTFRSPLRDQPPRPGAETKWAWPLSPEHVALPFAWAAFCREVRLTSRQAVDNKIRTLHAGLAQLVLGDFDDDDG